ncbi:DNA-binding transcriptional activator XapR [compost metagenome]
MAARENVRLADLGEQPFIIHSRALVPTMYALTQYAFQAAGIQPPIAQEAVQVHTILGLVEGGLGVALLPDAVCRYAGGGVVFLPLDGLADTLLVGTAVAVLEDAVTPTARHFIEHAHSVATPVGITTPGE